jgi:hypothetical protein
MSANPLFPFFQGAQLVKPGVYYADNVNAVQPTPPTGALPLIYVGFGNGPQPKTPIQFASLTAGQNTLRNGPAAKYLPFMFLPGSGLNGANTITYIEAGENVQSTFNYLDSSGSSVIQATSNVYGNSANLLQTSVSSGNIGGIDLTITDGFSGNSVSANNLGVPFQLAYLGSATGVTYSVISSGGTITDFIVNSPNPGESFTVPISDTTYSTIAQIVAYLNGTGYYSAVLVTNGGLPATSLDVVSNVALPVGSAGSYVYENVTATLGDPVWWINNLSGMATAVVTSGAVSNPANIPVNIPLSSFTGGQSIPPTLADYAAALVVAEKVSGFALFMDSNSPDVVMLGTQHADLMSTIRERRYRRFFSGSSVGDSLAQAIGIATSMDSISATYVFPGIITISTSTGLPETHGGLAAAAAAAGFVCGNRIAEPLTSKVLNAIGVEQKLDTAQTLQAQSSGLMVVTQSISTGLVSFLNDFTTWVQDQNVENVLNQQVACRYATAYYLINLLTPYIGQINAGLISLQKIKNTIMTGLNDIVYAQSGSSGWLSSWDPKSLTLNFDGTTMTLSVQVNVVFVGQNRYITNYVVVQPLEANVVG